MEFSGKEERSWALLLRNQIGKDTRFMQNYFFIYNSTSIAHAGLSMPSVAPKVHLRVFCVAHVKPEHAGYC